MAEASITSSSRPRELTLTLWTQIPVSEMFQVSIPRVVDTDGLCGEVESTSQEKDSMFFLFFFLRGVEV